MLTSAAWVRVNGSPPSLKWRRSWGSNFPDGPHAPTLVGQPESKERAQPRPGLDSAGWKTAQDDMEAETLLFRCREPEPLGNLGLDELWLVHSAGAWPSDLSLCREDIYDERI